MVVIGGPVSDIAAISVIVRATYSEIPVAEIAFAYLLDNNMVLFIAGLVMVG